MGGTAASPKRVELQVSPGWVEQLPHLRGLSYRSHLGGWNYTASPERAEPQVSPGWVELVRAELQVYGSYLGGWSWWGLSYGSYLGGWSWWGRGKGSPPLRRWRYTLKLGKLPTCLVFIDALRK